MNKMSEKRYLQRIQMASPPYGFSCGWLMCLIAEIALRTVQNFPKNQRKRRERENNKDYYAAAEPRHDWWFA